jgi:lipopolysaccharide export system permease protein
VWSVALRYYATKTPRIVSIVGPYMTLFAGIATILSLARTNELVPMLTAGRSVHRVLLPVYLFAALAAGTLIVFEERVVPRAIRENALLDRKVKDFGKVEVGRVPHLTDGTNRFSVGRWFPREQKLTAVVCQRFTDPSGALPPGSLEVKEMFFRKHPATGVVGWYPVDAVLRPAGVGPEGRVVGAITLPFDRPVPFRYTPDDIDVLADSAEEGLERRKLVDLQRRFPTQHKWAVDLHTRTTRPVASFVLLLLGIPFVATPEKRSIAWGLGLALFVCLGYFLVDFLCRDIGANAWQGVNPVAAVWTPPILFTAVALALMDRVVT